MMPTRMCSRQLQLLVALLECDAALPAVRFPGQVVTVTRTTEGRQVSDPILSEQQRRLCIQKLGCWWGSPASNIAGLPYHVVTCTDVMTAAFAHRSLKQAAVGNSLPRPGLASVQTSNLRSTGPRALSSMITY